MEMIKTIIPNALKVAPAQKETPPEQVISVYENRAVKALNDLKIEYCTEQQVKDKLTLIYSITGLRRHHWPEGEEKKDLVDYIRMKYAKKTLSEFVLAFDLAISGELELTREEVKVYDQFTIAYLAIIMSAYKSWLYAIWKSKQVEVKPVQIIYSDGQLANFCRMDIENFYQRCLDGEIVKDIPAYFLQQLIADGFMAEGSNDMLAFFEEKLNNNVQMLYATD